MSKVQVFKLDKDKSGLVHKILGVIFIIIGVLLLLPYIIHFLRIVLAIFLLGGGVYFLVKDTRFRWFRIRRF